MIKDFFSVIIFVFNLDNNVNILRYIFMFVILYIRYLIYKYWCFYGWGLFFYLMNLYYSLFDFLVFFVIDLKFVIIKLG